MTVSRDTQSSERIAIVPDAEKLAALAEFAAGAGHEINNPLATIVGRVQQLLRDETDPSRRAALHNIGAQAYRVRDMIGDVMLFARPPLPVPRQLDIAEVAGDVLKKFKADPRSALCAVVTDFAAGTEIFADPAQFAVVMHDLLSNARQALSPNGGEIRWNARRVSLGDRNWSEIVLIDHGIGFSATEARHAFDPYFSGRQAGRGLGFGLCKCLRIAEMHHAMLEVASSSAGPTTVRVIWPADAPSARPLDG